MHNKAKSVKQALGKLIIKKTSKVPLPPKPAVLKEELWYKAAWERFSVSKRQMAYRAERSGH